MKQLKLFPAFLIIAFITIGCKEQSVNISKEEEINNELTKIIKNQWDDFSVKYPNLPGGISAMVLTEKGSYFSTYKMGPVMTQDTRFRVASITKTFTASAIMLLQQRGLLNINDNIFSKIPGKEITYLPETSGYNIPYKEQITIKQILEHRAGIFDLNNSEIPDNLNLPYAGENYIGYRLTQDPQATITADEMAEVISLNQLSYFVPGSDYHYSDTGYSLLSKIIERVTGNSFKDFMTNNLLKPNKLDSSILPYLGTEQNIPEPFIIGYNYFNGQFVPVESDNISFQIGNGNLISTLKDLATFAKLLFNGQSGIDMQYVDMMKITIPTPTGAPYGLGIHKIDGLGFGHSGAVNGYLSAMYFVPGQNLSIALISDVLIWSDIKNEAIFHRDLAIRIKEFFENVN